MRPHLRLGENTKVTGERAFCLLHFNNHIGLHMHPTLFLTTLLSPYGDYLPVLNTTTLVLPKKQFLIYFLGAKVEKRESTSEYKNLPLLS